MADRYDNMDYVKARRNRAPASLGEQESEDSVGTPDVSAPAVSDSTVGKDIDLGMDTSAAQAGASSGNPYAAAAGMGLSVLADAAKRRDQQKILDYQAKQDRIQRQQQAIAKLIGITDSMRQL